MKSNVEPALYKSIVAYDGTDFLGFQRQTASERTVQQVLEQALRTVGWSAQSLRAAGRTDAGAHARGQVIAYRLAWRHEPGRLTQALNAALPADIAVQHTEPAPEGFDPRFSASGRRYTYHLTVSPEPDPFVERYAWRRWPAPELDRLNELAALFIGRRDYGAFGSAPIPGGHSVRQIDRSEWERQGDRLAYTVQADAFLYHMVRRIVGAMLQACVGGEPEDRLRAALRDPEHSWNGRIAPARGLFLEAVQYEERRDRVAKNILSKI